MNTHHTNHLGDVGTAKVIARLAELGYYVFTPISINTPVDILVSDGVTHFSVEVKARSKHPVRGNYEVSFQPSGKRGGRGFSYRKADTSKLTCDILAMYLVDIDKVIFVNRERIEMQGSITVRESSPKNFQKSKINLIEEFLELKLPKGNAE